MESIKHDWEVHCPPVFTVMTLLSPLATLCHASVGVSDAEEYEISQRIQHEEDLTLLLCFRSSGEPVVLCWPATLSFSSQFKASSSSLEEAMISAGNSGSSSSWKALSLRICIVRICVHMGYRFEYAEFFYTFIS